MEISGIPIMSLFFGCMFFTASAQPMSCDRQTDTLCYVTLDIRGPGKYPLIMSGLGSESLDRVLVSGTVDSLLESFYSRYSYVPDVFTGYNKMLTFCMGDSLAAIYKREHRNDLPFFIERSRKKSIHKKLKLHTGETVFIDKVRIGGTFWKVKKSFPGLASTSNERDIKGIEQIKECYVPLEINFYERPENW